MRTFQGAAARAILIASAAFIASAGGGASGEPPGDIEAGDPRLGEKVDRICFARDINGWKTIDGVDDAVLLEEGVNDWYRVDLGGACRSRDFRFAETIGIESRPAGGCVTRGDVILVRGAGSFTNRCFISAIYRWNDDLPAQQADSEVEGS